MNKPEIIPPKRDVAYYLSRAAKARQDAAFMPARGREVMLSAAKAWESCARFAAYMEGVR